MQKNNCALGRSAFAVSARLFSILLLDAFLRIPLGLTFDKSREQQNLTG